jgi:hypothetical protein
LGIFSRSLDAFEQALKSILKTPLLEWERKCALQNRKNREALEAYENLLTLDMRACLPGTTEKLSFQGQRPA